MDSPDSSPVQNPDPVEEARNQTSVIDQNRFPWTTLIIVLLVVLIAGAIFLLARA